jgi:hypothetical protein
MGSLSSNTVLTHPETGVPVSLLKGQEIPDWAEGLVGDHLVDQVQPAAPAETPAVDEMPPTSGKGSGIEAWAGYANAKGIAYPEGANRDEIIAAVQAHNAGL